MHILVLYPERQRLRYALFRDFEAIPRVAGYHPFAYSETADASSLQALLHSLPAMPDAAGVRVVYGGEEFSGPAAANAESIAALDRLIPAAPLHLPRVVRLLRALGEAAPDLPTMLAFETSFFVALPERERFYAVDVEAVGWPGLRRYGYHGLLHQNAWRYAQRKSNSERGATRVLSLCLEKRPELAAIRSGRPIMVSSGATPMEGLPGECSCGEIDPALVLIFHDLFGWGPEEINRVLTRESGLKGLTGADVTFADVFASTAAWARQARAIFRYRLLQAAGAGVAALGGLEAIVLSGCYARSLAGLGTWLRRRLRLRQPSPPRVVIMPQTVERIVADIAASVMAMPRSQG
ncbi:MAG: hypothetical protein N3A66_07955 [Planctomycetota bacterium]|nr:hypothetical protein [Planctomycetota bacterium]